MVQTTEQPVVPVRGAKLWPMSVEVYHLLGDEGVMEKNTELLYGLVYTKMPKSPYHCFLLRRLLELFRLAELRGFMVTSEQPLTFIDSEPEPDIAVVEGTNEDYLTAHPKTATLVVEICVTSHDYDRSKLRAYATGQVKECWLVLGPEQRVEVYSNPSGGAFTALSTHGPGGVLQSNAIPGLNLSLAALWKAETRLR